MVLISIILIALVPTTQGSGIAVEVEEFKSFLETTPEAIIFDVRTPEEYQVFHIRGAYQIDPLDIMNTGISQAVAILDEQGVAKDHPLGFYCNCGRGELAKALMEEVEKLGYNNTRYLLMTINEWPYKEDWVMGSNPDGPPYGSLTQNIGFLAFMAIVVLLAFIIGVLVLLHVLRSWNSEIYSTLNDQIFASKGLLAVIAGLSVISIITAAYQTYRFYFEGDCGCSAEGNYIFELYSDIWGIPVALLGALGVLVSLGICITYLVPLGEKLSPLLDRVALLEHLYYFRYPIWFLYQTGSVVFILDLMYIAYIAAETFCDLCLISQSIAILNWIILGFMYLKGVKGDKHSH